MTNSSDKLRLVPKLFEFAEEAASMSAAAGKGEDLYALVVMQAPPVLTFSHKNRAVLCAGVGRVEEALEVDRARWLRKRRGRCA